MNAAQMRSRCVDKPLMVGVALLKGYTFCINDRGFASIAEDDNGRVPGVLWEITKCCEKSLDRWEGVDRGCYYKKNVVVVHGTGSSVNALVYISSGVGGGFPSREYMGRVIEGAREHGLPEGYIEDTLLMVRVRDRAE